MAGKNAGIAVEHDIIEVSIVLPAILSLGDTRPW
jgi:hypothetical protein